jgi:hypothetical protein
MNKKHKIWIIFIILLLLLVIFVIYYFNNKPKLYCFWTGNNPLTENRKINLETLNNTGFDVKLITPNNLNNYILSKHPLHKGYQYLSLTHKSDYLRCYFMNFYGGGYSDIKRINDSWLEQFEELKNSDKWGNGYQEKSPLDIAYGSNEEINEQMKENYDKLIGNGCYILKKNTPLTNEWYNQMMKLMDEKYEMLKKYPAIKIRQNDASYEDNYLYPFKWNELLGMIFHPLVYKYNDKILRNLPYVNLDNYK